MFNNRALTIIVILLWTTLAFTEAFLSDFNATRVRRQAGCGFRCKGSGKCIDADQECDGTVNCEDESDESIACQRLRCPPFSFRCKYGACINPEFECDGKKDCRDNSDETSPTCKKTTGQCKKEEFQCNSGQCISRDLKCDGVAQCADGSDETLQVCGSIKCPGFAYKCAYGACVNGDAQCNGIKECADNSDEDYRLCGGKPPPPPPDPVTPVITVSPVNPTDGSCILPAHPTNGQWKVISGGTQIYHPGDTVTNFSTLNFTCNGNYIATEEMSFAVVLCVDGQWSPGVIGECIQICPRIPKKPRVKMTCTRNEYQVDCDMALANTIATFECEPFYESDQDLSLTSNRRTCEDGSWNAPPINCIPKCGVRGSEAEILIINGTNATVGDWPWHVGLYKIESGTNRKSYLCGGSLINPYTILTAAHCLTNDEGVPYPKSDFIVAVGKHYREFDDPNDLKNRQFSKLKEMHVHSDYKGYKQNFLADIGVLTTETAFELTKRVQPVCYDQSSRGDGDILKNPGKEGYVVGWGHTVEDGNPADVLKQVPVPYVPNDQCEAALPEDFDLFLTRDKICGGYLNRGTGVCKGDSGGGLVFKMKGRYFIRAIVSVAPKKKTGGCDSQHYSLYTRLHSYSLYIYQKSQWKP